jgi:hypothetical protein
VKKRVESGRERSPESAVAVVEAFVLDAGGVAAWAAGGAQINVAVAAAHAVVSVRFSADERSRLGTGRVPLSGSGQ